VNDLNVHYYCIDTPQNETTPTNSRNSCYSWRTRKLLFYNEYTKWSQVQWTTTLAEWNQHCTVLFTTVIVQQPVCNMQT